ncbi:MAG: ATPase [Candidatus Schekmanbacteria bacterium]|nr:ATPase [Candidatus Schekmanbacteria bacterium]
MAEASEGAAAGTVKAAGNEWTPGIKAIAAAIAISFCALGTALAQMKIGGAGAGAIAERPETAAMFIVLVAIPETIVILGFVIAAMLIVL